MRISYKFTLLLLLCLSVDCYGQNKLPTIDKTQYIGKFRLKGAYSSTTLPEKKAKKMQQPIELLGYLLVYNEDIGYFNNHPDGLIANLNEQKKFGRDNWRIPTPDELCVMEDNADKLGMGSDIYMCTDYANGTLRLVSTEGDYHNLIKVGNTYWMKTNLGANTPEEAGSLVTYEDAVRFCPKGYRLPTKQELDELIVSGKACFGGDFGTNKNNAQLYFPYNGTHETMYIGISIGYYTEYYGSYWSSDGNYYMSFSKNSNGEGSKKSPQTVRGGRGGECSVRYVLDK